MARIAPTSLLAVLMLFSSAFSQDVWRDIPAPADHPQRVIRPERFRAVEIDLAAFREKVVQAPEEIRPGDAWVPFMCELPTPDGGRTRFFIQKTPTLAPALVLKYPLISTFVGVDAETGAARLRMELTYSGLHAMIEDGDRSYFIEPFAFGDTQVYQIYFAEASQQRAHTFSCDTPADPRLEWPEPEGIENGDCQLRTYRLALACTGEYAQFHGGNKPQVLSAFATTINRINGVYEREVAVRFQLIPNTDTLIFLNAATDPYSNNNGAAMLGQNQTTVDSRIGSANYDIGHVFSTGGGGIASLGSVCLNGQKARGVTGSNVPVGDAFDIDYVAHEIGHQFGGRHTQNNNCNRDISSYEPGSGSTIMGYAGICSPNVQIGSDDYFHAISLQEITGFITTTGGVCPQTTALPNFSPIVSAGPDRVIPSGTPFELTAFAIDPDSADVLTYCWEQFDNAVAQMPPRAISTSGPMFRSFTPSLSPTRTFPRIQALVAGANSTWEVLPAVGRVLNFRLTVRDNAPVGGCTAEDDVRLTVDGNSGPFRVLTPNTNLTWLGGTYAEVRWDVANTHLPPVNAPLVNIRLSRDGGFTYPIMLAANAPNTGNARVLAPELAGSANRVRVEGAGHIFFDLSDQNFTIALAPSPTVALFSATDSATVCATDTARFSVELLPLRGFSAPFSAYVRNVPAGLQAVWAPASSLPGASELRVSPDSTALPGVYSLIAGIRLPGGDSVEKTFFIDYQLGAPGLAFPLLPSLGRIDADRTPTLVWGAQPGFFSYELEVARGPQFGSQTMYTASHIAATTFTLPVFLDAATVYYWRVRTRNVCGLGPWSQTFSFQTRGETCTSYPATFVPVVIPAFAATTFNSIRNVPDNFPVRSVRLNNIQGTHERISDLTIDLRSPQGTIVRLLDRPCPNVFNQSFFFSLSDQAQDTLACPPALAGIYKTFESTSAFFDQPSVGNWNLIVGDAVFGAGGQIDNYALALCRDTLSPAPPVFLTRDTLEVVRGSSAQLDTTHLWAAQPGASASQMRFNLVRMPAHGWLVLGQDTLALGDAFTLAELAAGQVAYLHGGSLTVADDFATDVSGPGSSWAGSRTTMVRVLNRTSVDAQQVPGMRVYPSPASATVKVELETLPVGNWRTRLLDLQGRSLAEVEVSSGRSAVFDTRGLASGLYLVVVEAKGLRLTQKIAIRQ